MDIIALLKTERDKAAQQVNAFSCRSDPRESRW